MAERFLLRSKLRPDCQNGRSVVRAALLSRLKRARATPLVIVQAPAGYGKTTLVDAWTRSDGRAIGWYSAEDRDDPALFTAYLAAALRQCAGAADSPGGPAVPVEELGRMFGSLPAPSILVVDNVHLLAGRPNLKTLAALRDRVTAGSQLVLLTRSPFDLPRGTSAALRLGGDDLRMNDAEAGAMLRVAGLALSNAEVRELNVRCEGWAAGLYLIAVAGRPAYERLQARGDTVGVDRFVEDYFRLEVLDGLDVSTRDFLLQASVVDPLSAPLCDSMLERADSAARLEQLAQSNLFVSRLDGDGASFRLHPLFRDVLRAELGRRDPDGGRVLLSRATDWYAAAGLDEAAVEASIAAGDAARAAELVVPAALHLYWSGREATLERWFLALDDPELLAANPALAVVGAGLTALGGRADMAERWMHAALNSDSAGRLPDGSSTEAWLAVLRGLMCADGVEQMREDAEYAVQTLADGSPLASSARLVLGYAHVLCGADEQAEIDFAATVDLALAVGAHVGASCALAALSSLAIARGALKEAAENADRAAAIVDGAGLGDYLTSAAVYAASARIALEHGNRSACRESVERASALLPRLTYTLAWLAVPVRIELAHLQLALDDPAAAHRLLGEIDAILDRRPELGVARTRADELRQELERGRSDEDGWTSTLTPAELRLLPLLASYLSFREIADLLEISRNTVKTQAIAVYRKLDVSSRSAAVERARELGLLSNGIVRSG